ncbi:MAG: hypothetical protein V8S08_09875 [Lachnoclostridium sp.]
MEGVNTRLREQFFYKWGKGEKRLQGVIYEEFFDGKYGLNASEGTRIRIYILLNPVSIRWKILFR